MLNRAREVARIMLVYALLGLGASVAVAWALAAFVDISNGTPYGEQGSDHNADTNYFQDNYLRSRTRYAARSYRTSIGASRRAFDYDPATSLLDELRQSRPPILNHLLDDINRHFPAGHSIPTPVDQFVQTAPIKKASKLEFGFLPPNAPEWGRLHRFKPETLGTDKLFWLEDARGFPFLCLWSSWTEEPTGLVGSGGFQLTDLPVGQARNSMGLRVRALPYRPIWAGLALNTLFYGIVIWLFARLLTGMRAARRFKKGLCTKCAYDLLFDYKHGCPECGWRLAPVMRQNSHAPKQQ